MSKKKSNKTTEVLEEEQVVVEEEVVDTETPVEEPVVEDEPKPFTGVVVNCTKLNVREQASMNAKVLCVLPASAEVAVLTDDGDWCYVRANDQVLGYCMKKYIRI